MLKARPRERVYSLKAIIITVTIVSFMVLTHILGWTGATAILLSKGAFSDPKIYFGIPVIVALMIAITGASFTSIRGTPEMAPASVFNRQQWIHMVSSFVLCASVEILIGTMLGYFQANFTIRSQITSLTMAYMTSILIGGGVIAAVLSCLSICAIHFLNGLAQFYQWSIEEDKKY